jgi:phosphatidylethanolamine/phosphatidyl-N-methylethanolamine N-methyltransferase
MAQDLFHFTRQFLATPLQVSAISPSSRFLARAMATGLGPSTGAVVEFGPGTGQLTKAILAAGVAASDLTLLEMSTEFTHLLRQRFAGVAVHCSGAQEVARFVAPASAGAVISGLPMLSMPDTEVEAILTAAFTVLQPNGEMRQFTYGNKLPVPARVMQKLGLVATPSEKVWMNLPPARVYVIKRATNKAFLACSRP